MHFIRVFIKSVDFIDFHCIPRARPFFQKKFAKGGKSSTICRMSISKYPRIRLHWTDILGDTAWAEKDEFMEMECSTCVSDGYLFYSDENKIMTFASYEVEDGEIVSYGDRNVYPIGCIKEIEYL